MQAEIRWALTAPQRRWSSGPERSRLGSVRPLAGCAGPVARLRARHEQSTGLFVSGLGLQRLATGRHGPPARAAPGSGSRARASHRRPARPRPRRHAGPVPAATSRAAAAAAARPIRPSPPRCPALRPAAPARWSRPGHPRPGSRRRTTSRRCRRGGSRPSASSLSAVPVLASSWSYRLANKRTRR